MIRQYKKRDKIHVIDFLNNHNNPDFYLTHNNTRIFIYDGKNFTLLLKDTTSLYLSEDKGDVDGIIMVWKAKGGNVERNYIKINAKNISIAKKLLTVLLWHTNLDLFIKLNKRSSYIQILKDKKFRFFGGRGKQALYWRKNYVRNSDKLRDESKKSNRGLSKD